MEVCGLMQKMSWGWVWWHPFTSGTQETGAGGHLGEFKASFLHESQAHLSQKGGRDEGEMGERERILVLAEDLGSQHHATTWRCTTICNSSSRRPDALFWLPQALYAHSTHVNVQAKHPYIKNKIKLKSLQK